MALPKMEQKVSNIGPKVKKQTTTTNVKEETESYTDPSSAEVKSEKMQVSNNGIQEKRS